MLANMVKQTHMLARFAMDSNMANILKIRTPFRMFFFEFRTSLITKTKKTFQIKMADSKDESSTAKSQKFRWEDEDIERLIDLYEARPCLWVIADPTYSKRDVREKALSEIKEELDIEINTIKSKWNSLRAQRGRELAKESKRKSGQSTGDVYESS